MSKIINREGNVVHETEFRFYDHPVYEGFMIMKRTTTQYRISAKTGKPLKASIVVTDDTMPIRRDELPALAQTALGAIAANSDQLRLERVMKD